MRGPLQDLDFEVVEKVLGPTWRCARLTADFFTISLKFQHKFFFMALYPWTKFPEEAKQLHSTSLRTFLNKILDMLHLQPYVGLFITERFPFALGWFNTQLFWTPQNTKWQWPNGSLVVSFHMAIHRPHSDVQAWLFTHWQNLPIWPWSATSVHFVESNADCCLKANVNVLPSFWGVQMGANHFDCKNSKTFLKQRTLDLGLFAL